MCLKTQKFVVWPVDSLQKVHREAQPEAEADRVDAEACRNEFTSAQVAVRAARPLRELRVSVQALKHEESGAGGIEIQPRFVGFVPVKTNTADTPQEELDCTAPCEVPDPLLQDEAVELEADSTQPIWLTIFVPPDAPAGTWTGVLKVHGDGETAEVSLQLTVHPVTLPAERHLSVTNWMNMSNFARFFGTEMYTDRFWRVVGNFARNMAAHRQNVVLCSNDLVHIGQEADGKLTFDFSDYDRWVETFDRAGCADLIEGGHIGRRGEGKWETPWFEWHKFSVRRRDGAEADMESDVVVEQLVKALVRHVRDRGWFERFVMHIVDEPAPHTEEDYKKKSRLVHEWVPGVRFLDAMSLMDARGDLDIWVPELSHFEEHREHYLNMRDEAGIELWFYTCMYPTGRYPNRFLDFSLLKTRILHWLNWRYRLTGYLHWGLNYWTEDPWKQDRLQKEYPPGDSWIVYPGSDGPLDSIRWEQMREGIQDYELLLLLDRRAKEAGRDQGRADEICSGIVPDPINYSRRESHLWAARREVISALQSL